MEIKITWCFWCDGYEFDYADGTADVEDVITAQMDKLGGATSPEPEMSEEEKEKKEKKE